MQQSRILLQRRVAEPRVRNERHGTSSGLRDVVFQLPQKSSGNNDTQVMRRLDVESRRSANSFSARPQRSIPSQSITTVHGPDLQSCETWNLAKPLLVYTSRWMRILGHIAHEVFEA